MNNNVVLIAIDVFFLKKKNENVNYTVDASILAITYV